MARFKKGDWVVIVDKRLEFNGKYDGVICEVTGYAIRDNCYYLRGVGIEPGSWSEEFLVPASEIIKVGSRLKVREDLYMDMYPLPLFGLNSCMEELKGNSVTVENAILRQKDGNIHICLQGNCWDWSLGMFERVFLDEDYKVENNIEKEEIKVEEKIVLTQEQKEELVGEMRDLLDEYDYSYSDSAIDKIIDNWFEAKEPIIRILSKHSNWNADKFQVQFNHTFNRVLDNKTRKKFFVWIEIHSLLNKILQPFKINGRTLSQVEDEYYALEIKQPICRNGYAIGVEKYLAAIEKQIKLKAEYSVFDGRRYTEESEEKFRKAREIFDILKYECTEQYISQEVADRLNKFDSELRVHRGHKTTKIVGKFCRMYGIDKAEDYGREYAKYCDAMNPLQVERHTILSVNPIDYLTMSFGNTWASCHTIDKENLRQRGGRSYHGCYSSGTMSYMLDETSMVFYTVDADYNGNYFELQDKISRNMFHFGEEKLIQGRVYPFDQTDDNHSCGNEIYKPYREIVQKIFADCLGVPNLWYNKKGTDECDKVTYHTGTHYKDVLHYGNCNVSYLRKTPDDIDFNTSCVHIGTRPVCINCGREHDIEDNISCCDSGERCVCCGELISQHDIEHGYVRETEDGYCCDSDGCAVWCEVHDCYETREDDHEYVDGYGWICEYGLNYSDEVERCVECGNIYLTEDGIVDAHGDFYCDRCAEDCLTYVEDENGYYRNEEVERCENCGEYFLKEDMVKIENDYYCECCAEELEEENEEDTEETA